MKTEHAEELARIQRLTSTTGEAVLSLERLRRDPLYAKKVHILTGFSSVEFLDALFDWVMAYTKDVLPRYYTSRYLREGANDDEKEDAWKTVDGKTLSRTPLDMHKNYMFFTLYVIRTSQWFILELHVHTARKGGLRRLFVDPDEEWNVRKRS